MTKPQEIAILRAEAKRLHLDIIITWRRGKGWFAGTTIENRRLIGFNHIAAQHNLQRAAASNIDIMVFIDDLHKH